MERTSHHASALHRRKQRSARGGLGVPAHHIQPQVIQNVEHLVLGGERRQQISGRGGRRVGGLGAARAGGHGWAQGGGCGRWGPGRGLAPAGGRGEASLRTAVSDLLARAAGSLTAYLRVERRVMDALGLRERCAYWLLAAWAGTIQSCSCLRRRCTRKARGTGRRRRCRSRARRCQLARPGTRGLPVCPAVCV